MGNSSRPGSVVVREIDHKPFEMNKEDYFVRELVWNGIEGRSYDLVRRRDDEVLTEESFDRYPTDAEIADVLTTANTRFPDRTPAEVGGYEVRTVGQVFPGRPGEYDLAPVITRKDGQHSTHLLFYRHDFPPEEKWLLKQGDYDLRDFGSALSDLVDREHEQRKLTQTSAR